MGAERADVGPLGIGIGGSGRGEDLEAAETVCEQGQGAEVCVWVSWMGGQGVKRDVKRDGSTYRYVRPAPFCDRLLAGVES